MVVNNTFHWCGVSKSWSKYTTEIAVVAIDRNGRFTILNGWNKKVAISVTDKERNFAFTLFTCYHFLSSLYSSLCLFISLSVCVFVSPCVCPSLPQAFACLSVPLSVYIYLSVRVFVSLCACLSMCSYLCLFLCPSLCLTLSFLLSLFILFCLTTSLYLYVDPSIFLSFHLSFFVFVCLGIFLFLSFF